LTSTCQAFGKWDFCVLGLLRLKFGIFGFHLPLATGVREVYILEAPITVSGGDYDGIV